MNKYSTGYILALFDLAKENSKIDDYLSNSRALLKAVEENEKVISIMDSPQVDLDDKYSLIDKTFGEWIEKELINTLKILAQRQNFSLLRNILKGLIKKLNNEKGITEGVVYSTSELDEGKISEMEKSTENKVGYKVSLVNKIDKELKFGFKIIIKDTVIEDSAISRLESIKSQLLEGEAL